MDNLALPNLLKNSWSLIVSAFSNQTWFGSLTADLITYSLVALIASILITRVIEQRSKREKEKNRQEMIPNHIWNGLPKILQSKAKFLIAAGLVASAVLLAGLALRYGNMRDLKYDLLVNISASVLLLAASVLLFDGISSWLMWRQIKEPFLYWTTLALNGFLLEVLEIARPGSGEEGKSAVDTDWRLLCSKFLTISQPELQAIFSSFPKSRRSELENLFTKLRQDLYEVTTLFGDRLDDAQLFGVITKLLEKVRHASEYVLRTPRGRGFMAEGVSWHLLVVVFWSEKLYSILKEKGASQAVIL